MEGGHVSKLQVPRCCRLTTPPASHPPRAHPQGPARVKQVLWAASGGRWGRARHPPPLPRLTLAFKLLGRSGKEQLALHVWGPSTAGDAWFLVARLHPAGQPAEVAVTVQGVGTDGPGQRAERNA